PDPEGMVLDTHSGYVEFRIELQNHSEAQDHDVRLIYPAKPGPAIGLDSLAVDSRSQHVASGERLTISIFKPPLPATGEDMAVAIDGSRQEGKVAISSPFRTGYRRTRASSSSTYGGGYGTYGPSVETYSAHGPLAVLCGREIDQKFKDGVLQSPMGMVGF